MAHEIVANNAHPRTQSTAAMTRPPGQPNIWIASSPGGSAHTPSKVPPTAPDGRHWHRPKLGQIRSDSVVEGIEKIKATTFATGRLKEDAPHASRKSETGPLTELTGINIASPSGPRQPVGLFVRLDR